MIDDHEIRIKRATLDDAVRIAVLHGQLFERGWDTAAISTMISGESRLGLVDVTAKEDRLVGFALVQIVLDEAELLSIGFAADQQRAGIGHRLMDAVVRACLGAGTRHIHLDVAATNDAARALYARHGFQVAGRRKDYYAVGDSRADAIQMRLDIG